MTELPAVASDAVAVLPVFGPQTKLQLMQSHQQVLVDRFRRKVAAGSCREREFHAELIAAENKRDPSLGLTIRRLSVHENVLLDVSGISDPLLRGLEERAGHWQALVDIDDKDGNHHRVALSAQYDDKLPGCISVLVIDSVRIGPCFNGWRDVAEQLATALKDAVPGDQGRVALSYISTETQKTDEGCSIFAILAARQMAKDPSVGEVHKRALHKLADSAEVVLYEMPPVKVLSARFLKYATSQSAVKDYLDANPGAKDSPVNDKGQTLTEYQEQHWDDRLKAFSFTRRQGTSYESKRLKMYSRAIDLIQEEP